MLQAYMTPKSKHHGRIPYEQGWNNHSCRTGNTKNKISWSLLVAIRITASTVIQGIQFSLKTWPLCFSAVAGCLRRVRVNQHPPVHQLAVLSTGWVVFLHPVPDPVLTQHCTGQLFWAADLWPFSFFGCLFPNPDLTSLQSSHPNSLPTLLT
jgi:hypothetical protein